MPSSSSPSQRRARCGSTAGHQRRLDRELPRRRTRTGAPQLRIKRTAYDYAGQDPINGYDLSGKAGGVPATPCPYSRKMCAHEGPTWTAVLGPAAVIGLLAAPAVGAELTGAAARAAVAAAPRVAAGTILVQRLGGPSQIGKNFLAGFNAADASFRGLQPALLKVAVQVLVGIRNVWKGG